MSDIPAVYGQFGQALGLASAPSPPSWREHLAQRNTVPEAWYTLRLLATRGPAYPRADLTRLLEGPGFDSDVAHALLDRLEADGLIRGDTHLDLTAAGEAPLSRPTRVHQPPLCAVAEPFRPRRHRDDRPHPCRRSPPRRAP